MVFGKPICLSTDVSLYVDADWLMSKEASLYLDGDWLMFKEANLYVDTDWLISNLEWLCTNAVISKQRNMYTKRVSK